ncbi:MAG TPA: DNA mismatch repair protein MutS [Flavobacteriales bacterium]|nr:DNA mismatch repair protein MutS [Flavobacteriales bacterium]HJN64474.1 DNA mismatch repair protein MutS [Flavobacteriales bacterium]
MTTKTKKQKKQTPLIGQYNRIKAKYPDAILLFRIGDFYETFGEDAIKASKILGIVLTNRANGSSRTELAGFPHHSLDTYLPKLVRAGNRVAICEQLEDPKLTKKIVKRGVTELVTPGVSYNDLVLENIQNNFLAAVYYGDENLGISFLDISTGEFLIAEGNTEYMDKLLQSFRPTEVLFQKENKKGFMQDFGEKHHTFAVDNWAFTTDYSTELLLNQFDTSTLKGFGIEQMQNGKVAAGVILHYLQETKHNHTQHIASISRIEKENHLWMDKFTIRNLELFYSPNEGAKTLVDVLDNTISPMGARMLKRWVALPLKEVSTINERLKVVDYFIGNNEFTSLIKEQISQIGDLERLISKVATARISPRECMQLQIGLEALVPIKDTCQNSSETTIKNIGKQIDVCQEIKQNIEKQLHPNPPALLSKGNVINIGVNSELDELRSISISAKEVLQQILERESQATGIPSLKISFNNVFGYYLEVRNTHKDKVPERWMRKQTLVNAERYITEELKEYEVKILSAEERIGMLEQKLYQDLVLSLTKFIAPIQRNAQLISKLDCLFSFAFISRKYKYKKPIIDNGKTLIIKGGRHPVIERQLKAGESYVPNNTQLDREQQQIIMITGPNMSGKSALLRQTALIVLMAQIGCFVPADAAQIGIVDKIFTRVGASDNISMGESTFMVEMNETASILNNISERSLILLDEIGRGTSTYDGVSIAWAIAEYLHEHPSKAKTLFATHYHELNEMTNSFDRIKNYNVSVKEIEGKIIFLRKLKKGGSAHSFGIHVAQMAGMPRSIVKRANNIMHQLESSHSAETLSEKAKKIHKIDDLQLSFFQLDDPVLIQIREELLDIDINTLTPVEALLKLNEIKKHIGKK